MVTESIKTRSQTWWQPPKTVPENLEYREKIRLRANGDPAFQSTLWNYCRKDFLFWVNTFAWLYEPREEDPDKPFVIPFVTYGEYQDEALMTILNCFGRKDILLMKSRDLGATWMFLTVSFWYWLFSTKRRPVYVGLLSENEDKVDEYSAKGTLFWKLDHLYDHLPAWMRPPRTRNLHIMENHWNNAAIKGSATTRHAFRGDRLTQIYLDEYAAFDSPKDSEVLPAVQHAAGARGFISTPIGDTNEYAKIAKDKTKNVERIRMHWSEHPKRKQGMYRFNKETRKLEILDPNIPSKYRFREGYPFILDGKTRSPYYDYECNQPGATPLTIAQELDIDFLGSVSRFFKDFDFDAYKAKYVREPEHVGMLTFNIETLDDPEFLPTGAGQLFLWCGLDVNGRPNPDRNYVVGCDVAAGSGNEHSSNSSAAVHDSITREQVAIFISNTINPFDFADYAIALCWFFCRDEDVGFDIKHHPAKLNWEANGSTGSQFTKQVVKVREYSNVYFRKTKHVGTDKDTKNPGWWSDPDEKSSVLGNWQNRLNRGQSIIHSDQVIEECKQFVFVNGKVYHVAELNTDDDSAMGAAHGDTVMASAIADLTLPEVERKRPNRNRKKEFDQKSMGWRLQQYDRERESEESRKPWEEPNVDPWS